MGAAPPAPAWWDRAALGTATVLVGVGTAVQTVVNTKCGAHVGVSLWGACVTFLVGIAVLTVGVAVEARATGVPLLRWTPPPRWYHLLPGILGVGYVAGGVVVSGAVGASLFFVPLIVGQLMSAQALDHYGLSTGGVRKPLDAWKAGALLLAVVGAVLSVTERLRAPGDVPPAAVVAYEVAALAVGALTPVQAALSRSAAARLPSRLAATWWSFSVGLLAIGAATGAQAAMLPAGATADFGARVADSQWWMFTGGLFGVAYIATTIWWAPRLGSAPYFVALVCGQLAGSAALDAVGAFGSPVAPLGPLRGVGVALVMAAAAALAAGTPAACGRHAPRGGAGGDACDDDGGGGGGGGGSAPTAAVGLLAGADAR